MAAAGGIDKGLESIIKRAVDDPDFRRLLNDNRAAALEGTDASPAVRDLVMSVEPKQLEAMIDRAAGTGTSLRRGSAAGCLLGGGLVAGALLFASSISMGHTRGSGDDVVVRHTLFRIAVAQAVYQSAHGSYADLNSLLAQEELADLKKLIDGHPRYRYEVTLDGDTFTATAAHATRPDTRKAFVVGPDAEVRELEQNPERSGANER